MMLVLIIIHHDVSVIIHYDVSVDHYSP
jgi:hypothetical protein